MIILDFDGVILESVSVKTDAFRNLFSNKPDYVDEIVDFHIQNGGMSRYDKFRHIYANILHEPLSEEQFDLLCRTFGELVYGGIIKSPFVDGALDFFDKYHRIVPLYIVSATPEAELIQIIKEREISQFFTQIHGAPKKKSDCIEEIITSSKYPLNSVIFIGDAINDWKAAEIIGVRFIGRIKPGDPDIFKNISGIERTVKDFNELNQYVGAELENI